MTVRAWWVLGLGALLLGACAKEPEVVVKAAKGSELGAEAIDRQPLALLPAGAVGVAYLDAPQLFASQFGPDLDQLARTLAPLPASSGFVPSRDLETIYLGMYSMQGLDFAGVARGRYDPDAIARAGEAAHASPGAGGVVRTEYGGRVLYTSGRAAFTVLTARTALIGNETGVRRALDRINEGRVAETVPEWFADLLEQPGAPVAAAMNLREQPLTDGVRKNLPFLEGMHTVRVLGNFQPPGMNFAGTAAYDDEAGAQRGQQGMQQVHATLRNMGVITAWFGIPQPISRFETQLQGQEVKFVAGVDGTAVRTLLRMASSRLASAPAGGG